jgi:hypothetical protein
MLSTTEIPNILDLIRQQERERFAEELRSLVYDRTGREPYNYSVRVGDCLNDAIDRCLA